MESVSLSDGHSEAPHGPLTAKNEVGLGLESEIPQGLPELRGIVNTECQRLMLTWLGNSVCPPGRASVCQSFCTPCSFVPYAAVFRLCTDMPSMEV